MPETEYKSAFNPDDRRPEGPVKVILTRDEASALSGFICADVVENLQAHKRGDNTGDALPAEADPIDWADYDRFRFNVHYLLGEGINGFEYDDLMHLQKLTRTELMLLDLGETERNKRLELSRDDLVVLLNKLGSD